MDVEERNAIMIEYQPLVAKRARHWFRKISTKSLLTVDDLVSHGQIGLMRGITSFNKDSGAALSSWIRINVDGYIREGIRKNREEMGVAKDSYYRYQTPIQNIEFKDEIHAPLVSRDFESDEERLWVLDQLWRLKPRNRIIALMYFYGAFEYEEISITVGRERQTVGERVRFIKKELKKWRTDGF